MTPHRRLWLKRLAVAALLAGLACVTAGVYAVRALDREMHELMGPGSSIASTELGWHEIVLHDVRMPMPQGWLKGAQLEESAHAARVRIQPELGSLAGGVTRIRTLQVEDATIVVRRGREGGMRLLPGITEKSRERHAVHFDSIVISDSVLEIYDESVPKPPHHMHLADVQARIDHLSAPSLDGRSEVELQGTLRGPQHSGKVHLQGWIELASRDSELNARFEGVDLEAVQPYLQSKQDGGVQQGRMDLRMQCSVRKRQLKAPGKLQLSDLHFKPDDDGEGRFLGVPRATVLNFMEKRRDPLQLDFVLEGDLDNPQFSLNETFSTRVGVAFAKVLGVSVEGLAQGVGTIGSKGVQALKGVGSGIGKLFGLGGKDETPPPQAPPGK